MGDKDKQPPWASVRTASSSGSLQAEGDLP